jgi:dienelactone hydrolase
VLAAVGVGPAGAASTPRGPFAIGVRTTRFVDAARPTPAVPALGLPGEAQRTITATAWYPARGPATTEPTPDARPAAGRFPLVVWAHGNSARGSAPPPVVRQWAAAGYVVVAPDFPVSSRVKGLLDAIDDWAAQPGDVRFVLDQVTRRSALTGLGRAIDARHVGLAGHSLGAITVLATAFGPDPDPRVDAVISLSGIPLLPGTDVASRPTPLLLVHSDNDGTVPYAQSTTTFAAAAGPHWLITVNGGGHSPFLYAPDGPTAKMLDTATLAFWDAYLRGNRAAADRIAAAGIPDRFVVTVGPSAG